MGWITYQSTKREILETLSLKFNKPLDQNALKEWIKVKLSSFDFATKNKRIFSLSF
jgi:hypothetical protein|tara:strand:+ start:584 stop:751 length:168 start_codon:yes stop_codon:yes gene_type:complete